MSSWSAVIHGRALGLLWWNSAAVWFWAGLERSCRVEEECSDAVTLRRNVMFTCWCHFSLSERSVTHLCLGSSRDKHRLHWFCFHGLLMETHHSFTQECPTQHFSHRYSPIQVLSIFIQHRRLSHEESSDRGFCIDFPQFHSSSSLVKLYF